MSRFEKVKQILDGLVGSDTIGAHGAFWRGLSVEQFRAMRVFGSPLVALGDAAGSNLVRSLKGLAPFGSDTGTRSATFRRMPAGRPAASDQQIQYIADWIDAGCPDDADPSEQSFALSGDERASQHRSW